MRTTLLHVKATKIVNTDLISVETVWSILSSFTFFVTSVCIYSFREGIWECFKPWATRRMWLERTSFYCISVAKGRVWAVSLWLPNVFLRVGSNGHTRIRTSTSLFCHLEVWSLTWIFCTFWVCHFLFYPVLLKRSEVLTFFKAIIFWRLMCIFFLFFSWSCTALLPPGFCYQCGF